MKPMQLWLAVLVMCGCVVGSAWYVGHTVSHAVDVTEMRAAFRVKYTESANRHILPSQPGDSKFELRTDGVDWVEEAVYGERTPRRAFGNTHK